MADLEGEALCDAMTRYVDGKDMTPEDIDRLQRSMPSRQWLDIHNSRARTLGEVVPITQGRNEYQIANAYRGEMQKALEEVIRIMNTARQSHEMIINFQIGPPDGFNRQHVVMLEVTKKLC